MNFKWIVQITGLILLFACSKEKEDNCVTCTHDGYSTSEFQEGKLNGRIKKILKEEFSTDYKFDEIFEEKRDSSKFFYNENGKLVESQYLGMSPIWVKKVDSMNKNILRYDHLQRLKSITQFWRNGEMQSHAKYAYTTSGLLSTEVEFHSDTLRPSLKIKKTYTYDSSARIVRSSWSTFLPRTKNSYHDVDSTVTKYQYDNSGRLSNSIDYNKYGGRVTETFYEYREEHNQIIINHRGSIQFGLDFDEYRTVLMFNDSCQLSKITHVESGRTEHTYTKVSLNEQGYLVNFVEFKMQATGMDFPDEIKLLEVKMLRSLDYEYKFDNQGNWTEKRDRNSIVRRKITYY